MRYEHVLGFALEHPWALTKPMLAIVANVLARHLAGVDGDPGELAALVNRKNLPQPTRGGVAIIPVYGVIAPRMNLLSEMSGGTTFDVLTSQLQEAVANDGVKTIVFDVDSPGGNVAGATEFAAEVLKARAVKPVIAQANFLMASAAYWPMACATQVVAAPSAMIGSVGVYGIHDDVTAALDQMGIKREVISAGRYKAEGVGGGPLSEEARAHIKGVIDSVYDRMVADICAGRGVKAGDVRNGYGEGRAVTADAALALGMVDRIGTMADTLARLLPNGTAKSSRSALAGVTDQEQPMAATSQERQADVQWQVAIESALLSLDV
jgi:signal peptide peptidase SppA